ncbi:MAG: biliverdin-producing heme oxygenase [Gemmatimonadota bacterium]
MSQLADRLRLETKSSHHRAERTGVMPLLLAGKADRATYFLLIRNLLPVYQALERALRSVAQDPVISGGIYPELWREPALVADLEVLGGPSWSDTAPLPEALRYAARIEAAVERPVLLLAHAYVRYLGDLSGGQVLKRLVRSQLGLEGEDGTSFYDFPAVADIDAFKTKYRETLNRLPLSSADQDAVIAEAIEAFRLNMDLFDAVPSAAPRPPS